MGGIVSKVDLNMLDRLSNFDYSQRNSKVVQINLGRKNDSSSTRSNSPPSRTPPSRKKLRSRHPGALQYLL